MSKITSYLYKILLPITFVFVLFSFQDGVVVTQEVAASDSICNDLATKYQKLNLSKTGLSLDAFEKAYVGWLSLNHQSKLNKKEILAIADLSQSANMKRLYVIDLNRDTLLFQTFVAHGRNSGQEYAQSFSNEANSYQSSLGFYTTGDSYQGKHGLSLKLSGMEPAINDLAEERAIVIHGADYATENFIKKNGRLGRSLGCPAVSPEMCEPLIQILKDGACLFMYFPDEQYLKTSSLCKG
jgi:hypothetical protein